MTEAIVNLVVSVPVLVSSKDLVANDGGGTVVNGSGVENLNGMEVHVLDTAGYESTVPSLSAGTYKLLVGGTSDCGNGPVLLSPATDVTLTSVASSSSSETQSSAAASSSSSCVTLPPPSSCSSLMLLGEIADEQLSAAALVQ